MKTEKTSSASKEEGIRLVERLEQDGAVRTTYTSEGEVLKIQELENSLSQAIPVTQFEIRNDGGVGDEQFPRIFSPIYKKAMLNQRIRYTASHVCTNKGPLNSMNFTEYKLEILSGELVGLSVERTLF